jgi:hypothetical protein
VIIGIGTTETGEQHFFVTKQLTHSLSSECAVLTPSLNLNFADAIFTFLRGMKFFCFVFSCKSGFDKRIGILILIPYWVQELPHWDPGP